jgi:hypothetical protein
MVRWKQNAMNGKKLNWTTTQKFLFMSHEYTSTVGIRAVRIRQETKEMLVSTALCPDS